MVFLSGISMTSLSRRSVIFSTFLGVAAGCAILWAGYGWVSREFKIDSCLDGSGAWDYGGDRCITYELSQEMNNCQLRGDSWDTNMGKCIPPFKNKDDFLRRTSPQAVN